MIFFPKHEVFSAPLSSFRGIGPMALKELASKGATDAKKILLWPPSGYQDRRRLLLPGELKDGEQAFVKLFCETSSVIPAGSFVRFNMRADDGSGLTVVWFRNLPMALSLLKPGRSYFVYGICRFYNGRPSIAHPTVTEADGQETENPPSLFGVFPLYSPIGRLTSNRRANLVGQILDRLNDVPDLLPKEILARHALQNPVDYLKTIHRPPAEAKGTLPKPGGSRAFKKLCLLELAFWRLALLYGSPRKMAGQTPAVVPAEAQNAADAFFALLPFAPSEEQKRVVREILIDLAEPTPMNRLLQGEVGCGKTAVAAAAAISELAQGRQAALMAPTEILARQHLDFFQPICEKLGFEVVHLTGLMKKAERRAALARLADASPCLVIGTQALASRDVTYGRLSLVVIDEQQRFGVKMRLALQNKNPNTNVLSLSATPIPSSLSAILHAGLDISSIKGVLPGRRQPVTRVYAAKDADQAFADLAAFVAAGEQAFVVCPRISSSSRDPSAEPLFDEEGVSQPSSPKWAALEAEETDFGSPEAPARPFGKGSKAKSKKPEATVVAKRLKAMLPGVEVGLLHRSLAPSSRRAAIDKFRQGAVRILVATTMVEVGVDVPAVNVMLAYGAECFGLSQLHQLRGRIGRGGGQGHFLLVPSGELASDKTKERLEAVQNTCDGYLLAEKDLSLRGPGEEMGLQQSGWPEFDVASLPRDLPLLPAAVELARDLLDNQELWNGHLREAVEEARRELAWENDEEE
ncbi:MAG: DEAD/DEAH box helicase [Deltaproteobacteria bacterium]|jgi:ATP-dependent DNA helicase RecG|nr:DEAD/DEAH box helicase [Deltaproteobacteria bacterium]